MTQNRKLCARASIKQSSEKTMGCIALQNITAVDRKLNGNVFVAHKVVSVHLVRAFNWNCGFCLYHSEFRNDGAHTVGDSIPVATVYLFSFQCHQFVVELFKESESERENDGINDRRMRVDGMFLRYNWVCDSFNWINHNNLLENWIQHWQRVHNLQIKNSHN